MMDRPLRATHHCRHYSYARGKDWVLGEGSGPRCAVGCDLSDPMASNACMPDATMRDRVPPCPRRADYTDDERAAWKAWCRAGMDRLAQVIAALPHPIPVRASGSITCPCCGGTVSYARWVGGAMVQCSTPDCAAARFNIDRGADWPATNKGRGA